jgi:hypothetical protein
MKRVSDKRAARIKELSEQPRRQWLAGKRQWKDRAPLKKQSRATKKLYGKYYEIQAKFLELNPGCAICLARGLSSRPATEVHHIRGRSPKLLCDTLFFCPSCFQCRSWPHDNPRQAREVGILAEANDWKRSPTAEERAQLIANNYGWNRPPE